MNSESVMDPQDPQEETNIEPVLQPAVEVEPVASEVSGVVEVVAPVAESAEAPMSVEGDVDVEDALASAQVEEAEETEPAQPIAEVEVVDALPTEVAEVAVAEGVATVPSTETTETEKPDAAPCYTVERVETEADARAEVSLDADQEFVIKVPKRKKAAPKAANAEKGEKTDKPKAPRKSSKKGDKLPDPGDGSGYEAPQTAEGVDATEDSYWYAVHCYSGYENKVKHNLEQRIETMGMAGKIIEVVVPTEEEIEVRDGKRKTVERRVFPGYVMVHMRMSEESWHVVRNTPGVTRFIGMGNRPQPLSQQEVNQMVRRMEAEAPKIRVSYQALARRCALPMARLPTSWVW